MKRLYLALVCLPFLLGACQISAFETSVSTSSQRLYMNEAAQAVFIQETIVAYFPEAYPTMLAIAYCETRARPFVHWEPDGSLRPNLGGNSSAAGALQVLLYLHRDAIAAQELDMRDIDDYMQFVRYLYDTGGYPFSPWEESRHCWGHRIGDFTADVAHPTS